MSQERESGPRPDPDPELLAALFGRGDERRLARARLRADGRRRELAALEAGLTRAGDELRSASFANAREEARFVAGVLATSTRHDLSWRGDLRLALDFLRARLRASPALRLVAASLVLHLVAGPVVAYWMLREPAPEKRVHIEFELPSEHPFAPEAPPPAPESEPDDELVRLARAREARENELARARFVLGRCGPSAPVLEAAPEAGTAPELLVARARFLRDPRRVEAGPAPAPRDALALALWIELELDRLTLTGNASPELGPACLSLSESALDARSPGTAALVAAAIERATRLGLLEREPGTAAVAGKLLDGAWFEALALAGREHGLAESAAWRSWLAWGAESPGVFVR